MDIRNGNQRPNLCGPESQPSDEAVASLANVVDIREPQKPQRLSVASWIVEFHSMTLGKHWWTVVTEATEQALRLEVENEECESVGHGMTADGSLIPRY
ncbi:hypothetical protein CSAL01_12637 [Colletotrichum salicis]|uniref:Uncharacterized protein n=1 Tax=Colletotrichum salicis TaxID=1209931 RepID=A0A135V312_9PEZI|nr:hypothetical protein CSAL01_12637 [Colletotrichum salicis]